MPPPSGKNDTKAMSASSQAARRRASSRRHAGAPAARPRPGRPGLRRRQLVPGWRLVAPHLTARPGARGLVVARGSIGLYVCDIARALGASEVLYVDPDPAHRALARDFGATTAEVLEPLPQSYDIAVEATGRVDQLGLTVTCLAPEGICESAGNHFRPGELPLLDMYLTGVTLRVARDSVRAHIPDAVALAASGGVDPGKVVSHVIDWEDLPAARPEKHLKPVFVRAGAEDGS